MVSTPSSQNLTAHNDKALPENGQLDIGYRVHAKFVSTRSGTADSYLPQCNCGRTSSPDNVCVHTGYLFAGHVACLVARP